MVTRGTAAEGPNNGGKQRQFPALQTPTGGMQLALAPNRETSR